MNCRFQYIAHWLADIYSLNMNAAQERDSKFLLFFLFWVKIWPTYCLEKKTRLFQYLLCPFILVFWCPVKFQSGSFFYFFSGLVLIVSVILLAFKAVNIFSFSLNLFRFWSVIVYGFLVLNCAVLLPYENSIWLQLLCLSISFLQLLLTSSRRKENFNGEATWPFYLVTDHHSYQYYWGWKMTPAVILSLQNL